MATYVSSDNFIFFQADPNADGLINFGATGNAATTTDNEGDTSFEAGDPITFTITSSLPGTYVGALPVSLTGGGTELLPVIFEDAFYRVLIPSDKVASDYVAPNYTSEAALLGDLDTSSYTVCFAAGTMIATTGGETVVEHLRIGDQILTADGHAVSVKWIGRQTLLCAFTPADRFEPVRVAAGALGGGLPHRDLVLTADHALILDGLAVNAGALVNGTTITRVPAADLPERVTYYHIETEAHDVILANGAAAETFVDYIGRRAFDNHAEYVALYGDEPVIAEMPMPRISSRRQLPADLQVRFGIADFADDVTADTTAFLAARRVA